MALNENSVFFKRGESKNLFNLDGSLKQNIVNKGGFYLTTDTNRLYYGADDNQIAEINRYIKTIDSLEDGSKVPAAADGDFLYIKEDNILAVWNNGAWKQVNPDTDTNTKVATLSFAKDEKSSDHTKLVYQATITQTEKDGGDGPTITGSLTIDAAALAQITIDVGVDVGVTVDDTNKATVKTQNVDNKAGAAGNGFTIEGDGAVVSVEATNTGIKISGDLPEYDLNSPQGKTDVYLSKNGSDNDKVTFKVSTDNDDLVIDGSNTDEIVYGHKTYSADSEIQKTSEVDQLQHEGTFTAISGVKTSNGHVTEVVTTTYTLPEDINTTYFIPKEGDTEYGDGIIADSTGKITIKLIGSDGNSEYGSVSGQDLYYTLDDLAQTKIYNQGKLPIYDIVNKSLQGVNALIYKGTVGDSSEISTTVSELPSTNVSIGDTYLVAVEGTYNAISAEVGDLFIATGTEEDDGIISPDAIEWTYVPSGDDIDTQYRFTAQADGIIRLANAADISVYDQIKLKPGTDIEITTEAIGNNGEINIKHKEYNYSAQEESTNIELAHEQKFKAITGLTVTNGHVSAAQVSTFVLPEDNNTTYTLPVTTNAANTSAKITLTGTDGSLENVYFDAEQTNNDSISVTVKDTSHIAFEHKDFGDWKNPEVVSTTSQLEAEQTIKLITGATVDNGHITALNTTDYILPIDNDSKYNLSGAVVAADTTNSNVLSSITITDTLTGSGSAEGQIDKSKLTVSSDTLTLVAGTNAYSINLEWGTF